MAADTLLTSRRPLRCRTFAARAASTRTRLKASERQTEPPPTPPSAVISATQQCNNAAFSGAVVAAGARTIYWQGLRLSVAFEPDRVEGKLRPHGIERRQDPLGTKGGWLLDGFCTTTIGEVEGWDAFLASHKKMLLLHPLVSSIACFALPSIVLYSLFVFLVVEAD